MDTIGSTEKCSTFLLLSTRNMAGAGLSSMTTAMMVVSVLSTSVDELMAENKARGEGAFASEDSRWTGEHWLRWSLS